MKIISTFILLLVTSVSFSIEEYDGQNNYVIGYFPEFSQTELDDPMSGAASAIDHIEWAIFDTVKCLKNSGVIAKPKEIYGSQIRISNNGKSKTYSLPSGENQDIGIIFLKAGEEPHFLTAKQGPSSLILLAPQEANAIFRINGCTPNP